MVRERFPRVVRAPLSGLVLVLVLRLASYIDAVLLAVALLLCLEVHVPFVSRERWQVDVEERVAAVRAVVVLSRALRKAERRERNNVAPLELLDGRGAAAELATLCQAVLAVAQVENPAVEARLASTLLLLLGVVVLVLLALLALGGSAHLPRRE